MNLDRSDRFLGCLVGLAVADAVGTTLEFQARDSYTHLTDMVGGGPFNLPVGAWTDDTSMALCLAHSLVHHKGFDAADQMRRYCNWMQHGYMSSIGHCFDIGNATSAALNRFLATGEPFSGSTDPMSAGNGSIMRLAPVPMFYANNLEKTVRFSAESSRTTHGAAECLDACRHFGAMLHNALNGTDKETILNTQMSISERKIAHVATGDYRKKSRAQIRGSGYVVESLEAALWCFDQTSSYRDAVLMAANLGEDADTTAAVVGQIAGAFYGYTGIPQSWRDRVMMHDEIVSLASDLESVSNSSE